MSTLNFFFLLVEDLHVLLEPLFCFFSFGVVLLQVLAEVDEMDLDLKISFADVVLLGFEVVLVPEYQPGYFLNSSF